MKLLYRYMKKYKWPIFLGMALKMLSTLCELSLPRILEHLLDEVAPRGELKQVFLWGFLMILAAVCTWQVNMAANRKAVENAHNVSYDVRQDLFQKTANLPYPGDGPRGRGGAGHPPGADGEGGAYYRLYAAQFG